MTRFIDNWGKEYRVEQEEFKNFSDEMAKNGRRFARIQTLVNPKTGEEWEGADWDDAAKDGLQPWEQRSIDDAKEAFKSRIAEGWQHKQREDESNIVTDTLKELNNGENWVDPDGEQNAAEYHAKNIAAGVGSAAVAGVTGLADAIQGTVLNAAAFTSRALGAEDAADTIADVRKDASDNIRAMREKATDAIIEGLDAKGMEDARDLVDTGLDVVEGFSGLYALGGVVGGATKGVVKVAGSMGKTVDAAKVGSTVLAGQMAADAYEHALDELEMQEDAADGKAINTMQKQIVAGARAAMSAATSKLFGKIAGIGIPKETTQKVIEQSLGRSARVLAQEMGEFALINDLNVLADEAGRLAAGVDRLDPEKGFWSRILDESLHGAGMVLGMKSQKILKGGWNAMMPMRAESFTKSMEAMKRAELGAIDAAGGLRVVATTPNGTGVLNTGGIVRVADGEVVTPDGCVITQDGKLRTVGAGRCGELEGGDYGIKVDAPKDGRRFGEDLTENACELVALAEEGLVETRKVRLEGLGGEPKAGENGIQLRANKDGTLELASDMPENERRKPVVALEHADGAIELVTGRKRVEAAKTSGEGEIDAIVIREKDGWTAQSAKVIDIVDNLMKGSPVTDAEAVSAANALGIGYERAVGWGLAQNGNVAAAFRLRENATAGLMNAVEFGHLSLETADAIARNANRRNMPGVASDNQIADIQLELAEKLKGRSAEEVDAVCRKLRERDMDAGEAADQAIRAKVLDEAIAAAERERLEEAAKKSGLTPEQEAKIDNTPMEREDGTLTTVREAELAERRLAERSSAIDTEHSSAINTEGERTALRVREDGVITSARFPEVEIVRSEEGGTAIFGLKAEEMLKRENREAVTDLLEEVGRSVGGFKISGEAELAAATELLKARAMKRKLDAAENRKAQIGEVLKVLEGSKLAGAVHTDQESFDAGLKQGKGVAQWLTDKDKVWGFTDGNEIWLNPKTARLETPIHEYGHLGIAMCKKVNREVYDRGIALAKEIGLFKEVSENEAYKNSSEESRAEEVLATIIGTRGEEALKGAPATLRAKVKEWLVDFWKAFGEALGLRDITPERAAKMTLEEVADAIRAEMMSGKRFGEKAESGQAERSSAINTAKARDIGDGTIRFQVDRNGKKKEYKRPEEALRDFIKELDGVKLDAEQQGVYDVMTGEKNTTDIRKDDIGNLIKLHKGGRGKGARKILSVHYAGKRGKVTAKEVINMGLVIREGRLTFDGSVEHPNSRRYELNAADGARLRVIVDLDKKGNEAVINLYSDREGGNPGHKASPGVKTTSSTPQIVSQEGGGKQEGLKYSIGGIFTGSAADYANRSREGGGDHKWTNGELKFSVKMIGTDEGVYKTSIDTKNPKTKDGRNTVIFRRDPRECDALLVESETIKAVEKALPENIKTGDKSIKYTESERIAVRNFVKEKAKAQRGEVQNPEFGEIIIGRDFEKEVQTHAISTAREIAAVSSAREIAAKMRHFAASPNEEIKRGRNRYIEYGLATFEFNGERYLVMGEVGVRENSTPYYDQRVVAKLKADTSSLSLHAGMKTESAFDAVYDNRFRILMQAAQEAGNNREVMMQMRRQELPKADGEDVASWLLNGRLRLADDAKYGLAERRLAEHSSAISTPIEVMTPSGDLKVMKPVEFAFSSLVELYQWMRGSPALPKILTKAHQEKRAWLGRITKGSEVELNPEMFGIVSKSDEVRIKAELKAEGRFRNEDPTWNLRHSKKQNDSERTMSEDLLEGRLRSLGEDRTRGKAAGEYAAPKAALSHELFALAMEMPANAKMPDIARALRTLGNGIVKIFEKDAAYIDKWKKSGFKVTEVEGHDSMLAEALQAVAWWRGYEGGVRQARDGRGELYEYKTAEDYFKNNHKELCAEVMGMFLTAPEELSNRALRLYYEIVERLAGDQKLLDAYNRLTEGYSGTGHAEAVMSKVMQQWSAKAERDVAQLKKELKSSQLGTLDNAWMNFKLGYWSRESPAMHHLARKIKSDRELAKANLKIAKKSGDKDEIKRAEANLKEVIAIGDGLVKRMKHENIVKYRGGTGDRNYINEFMSRVMGKSLEKHGITIQELDKYLFCQNVIATQGRAMAFGMSPSEAQKVLDNMRGTMGDVKWRQLEAASMEFHANRERNILSNPYVEKMIGKERIERWKRNVHYVRTERTLSVDEMALLNKGGKNGEKPEDMAIDVQEEFDTLMRLHMKKGARSGDHYLKHLVGSLSASERPTKATMMHDVMMAEYARRNYYIMNLAELATEAKLPGFKVVRDMSLRSVDGGERYGTLSYIKDGENYLLIVPKEVERAMQSDADAMNALVKFNRTVAKAMTTYNIRFAQRNMVRNRETNEANIEWMRPSLLKEGMGAFGLRGPANALELVIERAVVWLPDKWIRNPVLGTIWNPKTNMYFINEATRIAKLILVPGELRRVAEEADRLIQEAMEKGGDMDKAVAAANELRRDIEKSKEVMKHPMLSDSFQKVSGYGKGGADIEALFRKLDGTDAPKEGLERLPYLGKVWGAIKATGRKIEDLNTIEEARTKLVAWLSAEKQKEMLRLKGKKWKYGNASEIADIVATSSGAPMGEMRGTAMNWVEATLTGVFANVAMKGFARTVESARRAPWEWTFKALRRAENRAASILLWGGGGFVALCAAARKLFEDDEEMLQKIDRMEKWGKKVTRAFSMVSDYRIKNYDVLPLAMMGEDNVIAFGVPRGDEDRLLTPFVDYTIQQALGTDLMQKIGFNETISGRYGLGEAIGRTVLDSGMMPDVARGGIIMNVFDNLLAPLIDTNPYNRFIGRQTFDRDLWEQRGERKAEFVWEMTKRLWNDIGGGAILQAPMGAENSEGDLGEMKTWWTFDDQETTIPGAASVFDMLRKGPISSVAMSGFVFMNTKGTDRVEKKILAMKAEEKAVMDVIAMNCLDHLQKTGSRGEVAGIINAGIEKYGLEKDSFGLIERAVIKKQRELAKMTNRTTVPFKNLHKGIPDGTYQRIRKSLINTGWEIDD